MTAFCFPPQRLPFFEIALVPVSVDHIADRIVNADHSIV
jgi:hypothetical protein